VSDDKRGLCPVWLLLAAGAGYILFLRPQIRRWGTRLGESERRLPGDEIIAEPHVNLTNAVNLDAPPEAVWPWIAQMGRDHTGYYNLDLLLNDGVPSVNYLRRDLEPPAPGTPMDDGYHVMAVEPNRLLLFGAYDLVKLPGVPLDVTTLYLLERLPDGSTRLLVRHRAYLYNPVALLIRLGYELVHFTGIMQQFRFLKAHVTRMEHVRYSS